MENTVTMEKCKAGCKVDKLIMFFRADLESLSKLRAEVKAHRGNINTG